MRANLLPPLHVLLFPISSKGSFIYIIPDRIVHFLTHVSVVEHLLEQAIALMDLLQHEMTLSLGYVPLFQAGITC